MSKIILQGCRQHNLQNLNLSIPRNRLVVITGISGSGKSSLAFDTLFAEAQRQYLESLSLQARTMVHQLPKPALEFVSGLSPALAVSRQHVGHSARDTIATHTDIYDLLALLFTHIGEQHSPETGERLVRYNREEIPGLLMRNYAAGTRLQLIAPLPQTPNSFETTLLKLQQMGFMRIRVDHQEKEIGEPLVATDPSTLEVVVDRLILRQDISERLRSSVFAAMDLSRGVLKVQEGSTGPIQIYSEVYLTPSSQHSFAPLKPIDFNFNSIHGACRHCGGRGGYEMIDSQKLPFQPEELVFEQVEAVLQALPKRHALLYERVWELLAEHLKISESQIFKALSSAVLQQLLHGSPEEFFITLNADDENKRLKVRWKGLLPLIIEDLKTRPGKSRFSELACVSWQPCEACGGSRLKQEALACQINGKNIYDLLSLSIDDLIQQLTLLRLPKKEPVVAELVPRLISRLHFLHKVGLNYLTLNRQMTTLSEGEIQRVQLANHLGLQLVGVLYVLDEPTLGLHKQDIQPLIEALQELRDLGNTVVVVEHDRAVIEAADHLIELGPGAGRLGGNLVFEGSLAALQKASSPTAEWLRLKPTLLKKASKTASPQLSLHHASCHNIQDLSLNIPLGKLVGICGVSGSGKSTLANDILAPALKAHLKREVSALLSGAEQLQRLIVVDQELAGNSSKTVPATYLGLMTPLRQLFASTKLAKARGYSAAHFSLNKRGGRCENCEGMGQVRVNMQFFPDVYIPCEICEGKRYRFDLLQVTWNGHSMADLLNMTVAEAQKILAHVSHIADKLTTMSELGLDYLILGQPFNTLSRGEKQRIKLVAELETKISEPTLYLLDEPTSGLHYHDVVKLMRILHRLVETGHSVIVTEHNFDVLTQADWLIELGPKAGPEGGKVVFEGTPQQLKNAHTATAQALAKYLF